MAGASYPTPVLADVLQPERNNFGVIRLAMALAVLISHSYFFVSGTSQIEPLVAITGHSLGEHAVQVFFLLSGILVTQSLIKSGCVIDFAAARLLRIFPALVVCVLVSALVLGPLVSEAGPAGYFGNPLWAAYIVKTLLLVSGAAPLPSTFQDLPAAGLVNMSLWTLKYEVLCYSVLGTAGAMGVFAPRYRTMAILTAAAVVGFVFLKQPKGAGDYSNLENLRYFTLYFTTGVLACLVKEQLAVTALGAAAAGAVYAALMGTMFAELACAMFLGAATLYVAGIDFGALRRVTHGTDLSFGVYIYAAPIQQTLLSAFPGLAPLGLALLAVLIVLPVAFASWHLVERPALRARQPAVKAVRGWIGRCSCALSRTA